MLENLAIDLKTDPNQSLVILMCGIAGSGKSTLSKKIEAEKGFVRLSIDEEVWSFRGRYGIDYPVEKYEDYLDEAELRLINKLITFIQEKRNIVVDTSCWNRSIRENYKRVIENAGGNWKLVYLKVHPDELRRRLAIRNERFDANAAFPITQEILDSFIRGFEEPKGEGEIVLKSEMPSS
ncbi:AAA family ATPase [Chungangia koreensis]|uniref:AAA family ATPase n=1 Tax=Chungangia koreensis TaxID=752657 RepID=A0ABV8X5J7_9LACT